MTAGDPGPRLYGDLAAWWPLMSAPEDYAEEAGIYADLLGEACDGRLESLLELGSGGGNNAVHMKRRVGEVVLSDLSPAMLAVSRDLNPECAHFQGDMRDLRLDRRFDAVFVHDAVCYMRTRDELRRAVETAKVHCRPGGAVLFAPDYVRETFAPGCSEGGEDESAPPEGVCPRGLRYLEWVWDPDPDDGEYSVDYAYVLRERDGTTRVVHESHVEGLFRRQTWMALLRDAGFEARCVPLEHSEVEPGRHEMFVGRLIG